MSAVHRAVSRTSRSGERERREPRKTRVCPGRTRRRLIHAAQCALGPDRAPGERFAGNSFHITVVSVLGAHFARQRDAPSTVRTDLTLEGGAGRHGRATSQSVEKLLWR
jgi:hypothetical protein